MVGSGAVGDADGQNQQEKPQRKVGLMQPPRIVQRQRQRLDQDGRDDGDDHGRQRQPDQYKGQHKGAQLVVAAGAVGQVMDGIQAADQCCNPGAGRPQREKGRKQRGPAQLGPTHRQ